MIFQEKKYAVLYNQNQDHYLLFHLVKNVHEIRTIDPQIYTVHQLLLLRFEYQHDKLKLNKIMLVLYLCRFHPPRPLLLKKLHLLL